MNKGNNFLLLWMQKHGHTRTSKNSYEQMYRYQHGAKNWWGERGTGGCIGWRTIPEECLRGLTVWVLGGVLPEVGDLPERLL